MNLLKGKVMSGTHEAADYMRREGYRRQFQRILGWMPFPGTLNILVELEQEADVEHLRAHANIMMEPFDEDGRRFGGAQLRRARVGGHPAAIIFPERSRYGLEVVELVSPECLREKLGLEDGDEVEVRLD